MLLTDNRECFFYENKLHAQQNPSDSKVSKTFLSKEK